MTGTELREVLNKHVEWLNCNPDGVRANLYDANLRGADLCGANLYDANLRGANLCDANLCGANLRGANLYDANLYDANLRGADLCGANLRGANLCGANLYDANLRGADLRGANLCGANLRGAKNVPFIPMTCPDVGSYVAYKKVRGNRIVKLEIPADALRSSATSRKCRASKAIVLGIENLDGSSSEVDTAYSGWDSSFVYRVGEIVSVDNFDTDRWHECTSGIHHFINREEAVNYVL